MDARPEEGECSEWVHFSWALRARDGDWTTALWSLWSVECADAVGHLLHAQELESRMRLLDCRSWLGNASQVVVEHYAALRTARQSRHLDEARLIDLQTRICSGLQGVRERACCFETEVS